MALVLQKFNRVRDNSGRGFLSFRNRPATRFANERRCINSQTTPIPAGLTTISDCTRLRRDNVILDIQYGCPQVDERDIQVSGDLFPAHVKGGHLAALEPALFTMRHQRIRFLLHERIHHAFIWQYSSFLLCDMAINQELSLIVQGKLIQNKRALSKIVYFDTVLRGACLGPKPLFNHFTVRRAGQLKAQLGPRSEPCAALIEQPADDHTGQAAHQLDQSVHALSPSWSSLSLCAQGRQTALPPCRQRPCSDPDRFV